MSKFKLSNKIFDLHLPPTEFAVYTYLCSLQSDILTLDGKAVTVKQATIAQKCGIKAVQTVSKVITLLSERGLVEPIKRSVKANGYKGTYLYNVKHLSTEKEYFFADRSVFGKLIPRQLMIYLFICKSFSFQLGDSWNSYNDISRQTGMKRETVIDTINELVKLKFIIRCQRKARNNKRVYVDNHYQLIHYIRGTIRRKRKVRLHLQYSRTIKGTLAPSKVQYYNSTLLRKCQVLLKKFFSCRGSPQI